MKRVGIVILNYKVADDTIQCIRSIQKSQYKDFFIVVVDNASGDDIEKRLKSFPDVVFMQSKENSGYTGGNNLGIKEALRRGAELVFILNPDTYVEFECIGNCVAGLDKTGAGIVAPKILFDDKKTIWYAGGRFDFANVIGHHLGVDKVDRGQYEKVQETDYSSGAAMLVSRQVFAKIGFFDEKFFLYYEDSDFCFRAKQAGFKVIYIPKAVVYHKNAHSTGLGSSLQDYYITRNRMLFASKFLSFRTRFALFREAVKNLGNATRRLALRDYLLGKFYQGSYR